MLLIIDREKSSEIRRYLDAFINRFNCREKSSSSDVGIYECGLQAVTVTLLVFNDTPEEVLRRREQAIKRALESDRKLFKRRRVVERALERLRGEKLSCNSLGDPVERGICVLYVVVEEVLRESMA